MMGHMGVPLVDTLTKRCPNCDTVKPHTDFYKRARNGKPLTYCKPCHKVRSVKPTNEQARKYSEDYRSRGENRQRSRDCALNYYHERGYLTRIERKYGLAPEAYLAMLDAQNHVCAGCHKEALGNQRLSVDHDHETGEVRGLLCQKCNRAVGLMNDDPVVAARLTAYLGGS